MSSVCSLWESCLRMTTALLASVQPEYASAAQACKAVGLIGFVLAVHQHVLVVGMFGHPVMRLQAGQARHGCPARFTRPSREKRHACR